MVYSSSTMIFMVFLPLLWPVISGHLYNLECGPEEVPDFTIEPSDDGVLGRYLVQWCSQLANPTIEKWTFFLYTRNVSIKDCEFYKITDKQYIHSRIEQKIHKTFECPAKTCISTYLDLVYTGCYTLRNEFHLAQHQRKQDYRLRYIASGLNSLDDINSMKSAFVTETLDENIMLKIDSRIPLTDFYVKLCCEEECWYIENNCSVSRVGRDQLWAAVCVTSPQQAPHTNYTIHTSPVPTVVEMSALVSHVAPWSHGVMFHPNIKDVYLNFSYSPGEWRGAVLSTSSDASAVGGLALLALLVTVLTLAGLTTRRCRRTKEINQQHRYGSMRSGLPLKVPVSPLSDMIVLVYARDVPVLLQAVDSLTSAIHDNRIGRVVSLYSASTASACAACGGAATWVREAVSRGARVLLLQTPALLHATTTHALLPHGSGATPCGSQFGDTLVRLALRCLQSAPDGGGATAYRTYYVANLSENAAACEVAPLVAPYRRYELPAALPTLLEHLATVPGGVSNPESMVSAMRHMSAYLQYVRDHPHYLTDLAKHSH